jgi:hypothetical protein
MAVQHHLGGKGRVAADLGRQVAPVPVEDVERVVVDKGERLLSLDAHKSPHRAAPNELNTTRSGASPPGSNWVRFAANRLVRGRDVMAGYVRRMGKAGPRRGGDADQPGY